MNEIEIDSVERVDLPYLAETMVLAELSKRGIYSVRLPPQFDYDILCTYNARLEVKSATLQRTKKTVWVFSNTRTSHSSRGGVLEKKVVKKKRDCDYYVFVGFDIERKTHFFIIPNEIVGSRRSFRINPVKGSKYWDYHNSWDLLIGR